MNYVRISVALLGYPIYLQRTHLGDVGETL